jgi:hypothetical protein
MSQVNDEVLNKKNQLLLDDINKRLEEVADGTYNKGKEKALSNIANPNTLIEEDKIATYNGAEVTILDDLADGEVVINTNNPEIGEDGIITVDKSALTDVRNKPKDIEQLQITSAVININGKEYEGKNHAEAILKAQADGQDISQVDRQAEGLFKLSDGTIINREQAKEQFGQDRSELIIPQDEASNQANVEYKIIQDEQKNPITPVEPINAGQELNNGTGIQQVDGNGGEIQQGDGIGQVSGQEVPTEKVEEGVGGKMNDSWYGEFERAKKENDFKALDTLYNKVKVALNGLAQGKGEETVKQFENLKSDIEQYAEELKSKQPTVPKTGTTDNPALKDVANTAKALDAIDKEELEFISRKENNRRKGSFYEKAKGILFKGFGGNASIISDKFGSKYKYFTDNPDYAKAFSLEKEYLTQKGKVEKYETDYTKEFNTNEKDYDNEVLKYSGKKNINDLIAKDFDNFNDKLKADGYDVVNIKRNEPIIPSEAYRGHSADIRNVEVEEHLILNDKAIKKIADQPALLENNAKSISEAYHKAKADGSNPELVKAVEEALTPTPEVSKPVSEIAKTPISKTETTAILDEIKSKNLTHVKGKNMGENQALGTFISTEKGNRYETPTQKAEQVEIDIQNPFVVDNGDFGLVDKRQEILNANRDKFDEFDTVDYQKLPAGKLTVDNLNDAGIKKLAELTTNELKAKGYDGIYFRESDTQEGELVVFDKEKVKFKGNNINLVEQSNENGSNKGKSETKGTDAKTESSGAKNPESDTKTQSETTSGNAKRVIRKVKGTPKARRKVRNPEYLKALSHQAESAEDMVLQAFIGGAKISSEIIKKLYTNSGGEVSNKIGLLNKEGFATLSEMAHSLWENQESVFGFEKFDSQEFENAIEGVLNSYFGTKAMVEDLNKRFGSDIDAKQAEEFAKWKEFEANATEEEVSEMADYMESLSEEELNRIYNDKENAFADDYMTLAEGKKSTKRTTSEINADIKIKSAELKLLEEKQSKLNKQLEQNLKENQLDLLQGAKPQAMFDDKAEQQKIAKSLQDDIDAKRKEVAKLQDELDNINQEEIPFQSTDKKFTPIDKTEFEKLLDKLKKAFPNVKVELFGKGNMESAKKALEKYGVDLDLQSIYNIIGLSVLATSSTSQINQQPLITNAVSDNLNLSDGNVVEINDNRLIDKASGNKITDKNKMSASVTEGDIKKLTLLSNKHGVDPYTMIAMTMQETNFDTGLENPFHYDPQNWEKYKGISEDPMEIAVLVFKDKLKYAERLGKKTEAEKIQAYNGYGKIGKKTDAQKGSSVRSWYGISSSSFPIDMNKTPIYGNRVLDIRDNIIKSNPKIVKLVESQSNNIAFLKTKDGTIYGFKTPDGKVFINTDNLNANTPIHEFGHIWQSVFPQEFARGIELLKLSPQGQALIREIQKNPAYKGKTISEIHAEALVTAIGNKGESIFNSNPTLWNKFKEWLNDFFKKIGDKLGLGTLSADDKFNMFTKKVVGELLGGKVLSKDVGKTTSKTITFQGENIKVKEINGGAEVVNGFYSPLVH